MTSSLKQQFVGFCSSPLMLRTEWRRSKYQFFGLIQQVFEPSTIYRTGGRHANHYTVLCCVRQASSWSYQHALADNYCRYVDIALGGQYIVGCGKKLIINVWNIGNGLFPHLLPRGGARVLSVIRSEPLRKCSDVFLTYQVSRQPIVTCCGQFLS